MGQHTGVVTDSEIIEGDVLKSGEVAALMAWNDRARCPLLRCDLGLVRPGDRPIVRAWALSEIVRGRRLSVLLPAELEELRNASEEGASKA